MKIGPVFAKVIDGQYMGTNGRITRIDRIHYQRHNYALEIKPNQVRKFCGSILTESQTQEFTVVQNKTYEREFFDFHKRKLMIGDTVLYARAGRTTSAPDMVIGNVRAIDRSGVHVAPIAQNGIYVQQTETQRIAKTSSMMILDDSTRNTIMLNRLSAI